MTSTGPHRVDAARDSAGVRPDASFEITFDGRPITARPGETIAAALLGAGVTSWRSTRGDGRPRGVFCGIGMCFDCLVVVDGEGSQRACLRLAEPGATVSTQEGVRVVEPQD